jgi:hypothetical protein
MTPPLPGSGDADVIRASQLQHAVEGMGGDRHLGRPTLVRARAQPIADHLLPPRDGGLGPGSSRVPGRLLPAHPAVRGDEPEMAIARRRFGLGHLARHRRRARRDDDGRLGVAFRDAVVDAISIVGSCTLMLLFLYAMVEAQAVSPAGPEVAEASDGRLGIGE